jgi:hypothetical protein
MNCAAPGRAILPLPNAQGPAFLEIAAMLVIVCD